MYGIPNAVFDGYENVAGYSEGITLGYYMQIVQLHLQDASPLSIDAVYFWEASQLGSLFVHIEVEDTLHTTDNEVHIVIREDDVAGYPNLARKKLAGEEFVLNLPGESLDIKRGFTRLSAWKTDKIAPVVFVQSHGPTKEVLQAAEAVLQQGIGVTPEEGLAAVGDAGGPYSPSSVTYTVENVGPRTLEYIVSSEEPWVSITNATGTLYGYESIEVRVELNELAELFGEGFYPGTVTFENVTDHYGDQTREVSVQTKEAELIYSIDFEDDPFWTAEPQWERGLPLGGGGENGYPDPAAAHGGSFVCGYNLAGDYGNKLPETHLTSAPFDCSGLSVTSLRFWRWLGVEEEANDHAYVRVSTDSLNWTTVWANAEAVTDSAWTEVAYDIADLADGEPTVYLRWTMGATDQSHEYCGWNIDDVEMWGVVSEATGVEEEDLPDTGALSFSNHPNPCRPATAFSYELGERAHVRLTIHDLSGRLVSVVRDAPTGRGPQAAAWDGTNERGLPVASGVYFCRLQAGPLAETRKVVLLR